MKLLPIAIVVLTLAACIPPLMQVTFEAPNATVTASGWRSDVTGPGESVAEAPATIDPALPAAKLTAGAPRVLDLPPNTPNLSLIHI